MSSISISFLCSGAAVRQKYISGKKTETNIWSPDGETALFSPMCVRVVTIQSSSRRPAYAPERARSTFDEPLKGGIKPSLPPSRIAIRDGPIYLSCEHLSPYALGCKQMALSLVSPTMKRSRIVTPCLNSWAEKPACDCTHSIARAGIVEIHCVCRIAKQQRLWPTGI